MATRTAFFLMLTLTCGVAQARTPVAPAPDIGQRMVDTARTPVEDLNIDKDDVPDKLFIVQFDPYSLEGMDSCSALSAEINELTTLLGPDVDRDLSARYGADDAAVDVSRATLLSFIPFRGVIRELSGAAAKDRRIQWALWHGQARRSFLKGVGQSRGCTAPAAPVPKLGYEMAEYLGLEDPRFETLTYY